MGATHIGAINLARTMGVVNAAPTQIDRPMKCGNVGCHPNNVRARFIAPMCRTQSLAPRSTTTMNLYELISQNTSLRRVAATNGGEYAGPCPFCGGKDRFRVWPNSERPGFWCRGCGKRGDAIQYLRERDGLTFHEAQAQLTPGALFEEALATTSVKKAKAKNVKPASPLSDDGSPSWEWQTEAKILCRLACRTLWSPEGNQALAYLH